MKPEERAMRALGLLPNRAGPTDKVASVAQAIREAVEEEREACAAVAGTMAERPYDVEPEFSACLAIENAIRNRGKE